MFFLESPMCSYVFVVLLMCFLVFASNSLAKNRNIQALVKFDLFLTQKIRCKSKHGELMF